MTSYLEGYRHFTNTYYKIVKYNKLHVYFIDNIFVGIVLHYYCM
jgi:hypothetical protein